MAHIKLSDLDLDNRRVRVLGKGNKIGMAPFSPKTAKALWAWLTVRKTRAKTDRLWVTEEGNAFSIEGLVSWFARLKKRAGINSSGGVHRLRHTAALQYLRAARDSFLLQLFLRHEDLTMSRRYTQGLGARSEKPDFFQRVSGDGGACAKKSYDSREWTANRGNECLSLGCSHWCLVQLLRALEPFQKSILPLKGKKE